jgi:hypothetical protein
MSILAALAGGLQGAYQSNTRLDDIEREEAQKRAQLALQRDQLARAIAQDQSTSAHQRVMEEQGAKQLAGAEDQRLFNQSEAMVKAGYKGPVTGDQLAKLHPTTRALAFKEIERPAASGLVGLDGNPLTGNTLAPKAEDWTPLHLQKQGESERLAIAQAKAQADAARVAGNEQLRRDQMQQQQNQFMLSLADRGAARANSNDQAELNRQVRRDLSKARVQTLPAGVRDELSVLDTVQDLYNKALTDGEANNWVGIGGMGYGSAAQGIMKHTGMGDPRGEALRNMIANAKGTISKMRAGTALSANELQLLNTYAAGIDESPTAAKTKIKSFLEYVDILRENKLQQFGQSSQAPAPGGAPAQANPTVTAAIGGQPPQAPGVREYDATGRRIK